MAFKIFSAVIGSMFAWAAVPTTAHADAVLYGGLGGHGVLSGPQASTNDGALVIVSQTTGSTTLVGHPAGVARISGLAFGLDGTLFGATQPPGGYPPGNPGPALVSNLIRIDPGTGALISSLPNTDGGIPIGIADLAVHPTIGTLYGIGGLGTKANGSGKLYTINTISGAATFIGDTHRMLASIAFAPDGKLYMAAADFDFVKGDIVAPVLATLDPATAAILTSVPTPRFYHSLAVRPTDGLIFAGTGDEQGVYTIDPTSGAETPIGVTGRDLVGDFAFTPGNLQIAPLPGVWWDKNESGSGLGIDYENGTLIAQVYSYLAGGAAQWYLAAGTVVNNVFTATLDKYVNGQCISCTYKDPGPPVGNDGTITITFTSPTTATADLPGGRHIEIERFFQP
jgi:hypothetical protein